MGQAAAAAGVSRQTVWKWLKRYREEGETGLMDRSSRPHRSPHQRNIDQENLLVELRRRHHLTAQALAQATGIPRSTVGRVLRRHGISRTRDLEPRPEVVRYERQAPGELVHLDIKKLGRFQVAGHRVTGQRHDRNRGAGWEYVHVAVDDFSRLAYMEVLPDERAVTSVGFLERALAWYRRHGIETQRILTDNGSGYVSHLFAEACRTAGLKHKRTRPYTPRTNGKAERLIQTSLRAWAYARAYPSADQRREALPRWLHYYNHHRPHAALGRLPPAARVNNLLDTDS